MGANCIANVSQMLSHAFADKNALLSGFHLGFSSRGANATIAK